MDQIFERVNVGYLSKPTSNDPNRQAAQADRTIRYLLELLLAGRSSDTVAGAVPRDVFSANGFKVVPSSPAAMSVVVNPGLGMQYLPADVPTDIGTPDLVGVDDLAAYKPLVLGGAGAAFTVPTAPTTPNTRIDIIEVRANRELIDSETRRQLDPGSGAFNPHDFYTTLTWNLDGLTGTVAAPSDSTAAISYKVGVAANPGVAPSVTPGYVKIGEVRVGSGVTSIPENVIVDRRKLMGPGGVVRGSFRLRVFYLAGTVTISWSAACLPPGVQVAAVNTPTNQRGAANFYVVAGDISKVSLRMQTLAGVAVLNAQQAYLQVVAPYLAGGPGGAYVVEVDSTIQTELASATPPIAVAIGQKIIYIRHASRYIVDSGAGTTDINITDGFLDDVEISGDVEIAYH